MNKPETQSGGSLEPVGSVGRTAEQWNEEYRLLCANDDAVHGLLPNPQNVAFIQRVMDDSAARARREALMVATRAYRPPNTEVSDAGALTPELKPKREPGIR